MTGSQLPGDILSYVQQHTPNAEHVWHYFNDIRQIPRRTGNEAGIREYVERWALENRFASFKDETGNIVVNVPKDSGRGYSVCLQAHMDMVAAVDLGVIFDFAVDSIQLLLRGDYVTANGTSLGADNGMGIALAMAIATDPTIKHNGLELLFTVDEEGSCAGAKKLDLILKSRYLINLDSEDGHIIFNGCAGSIQLTGMLQAERSESYDHQFKMVVSGLEGGHSGANIHEESRGNAFYIGGKILEEIQGHFPLAVVGVRGAKTQVENAIPGYAEFTFSLGQDNELNAVGTPTILELTDKYKGLNVEINKEEGKFTAFSLEDSRNIVGLLTSAHSGVQEWITPGVLPQLSSNLGVVDTVEQGILIGVMSRSSIIKALEKRNSQLEELFRSYGFKPALIGPEDRMPPWDPAESELGNITMEVARTVFDNPTMESIHAGLEAGIILGKQPNMQAVSIGPKIRYPHGTKEDVSITSVGQNHEFLKKLVERL